MITDIFSSFDPTTHDIAIHQILVWLLGPIAILIWTAGRIPLRKRFKWIFHVNLIQEQCNRTQLTHDFESHKILGGMFLIFASSNFGSIIIPYAFPATSHLIFTASIAFPLWLSIIISRFYFKPLTTLASILPAGAPGWLNPLLVLIETIRIIVRPLTLAFRLAANLTAGHVVLSLIGVYTTAGILRVSISSIFLFLVNLGYIYFEVIITYIQAFIFCLLLTIYANECQAYSHYFFSLIKTLICGIKNANQQKIMTIIYSYLGCRSLILSFLIIFISSTLINSNSIILIEWKLEQISSFNLRLPLIIDKPGLFFSRIVLFISANVLFFSNSYIVSEKENNRFLILIIIFILSINLLIFIPHLFFLLLGWDGLGLVSFLLVIHYASPKSLAAGFTTVLTNRIGDALIIISIPLLFINLNLNPSVYQSSPPLENLIVVMITLAAMTKRAQIPFSSWLPAAMAAPTPISALVHSSTLVTAGVFLIYRFYPILSTSPLFTPILLTLASLTILIAGLIAYKENDIKKIIALSTLRQLGVIMYRLAINLPELAFAHILSHATFKALLFIAAGNLILQLSHTQDLRQFGNRRYKNPLTLIIMVITNLSLAGFPFLAGFYSKDLIIEIRLFNNINIIIFFILLIATAITLIYAIRFVFFIFFTRACNSNVISTIRVKDKNINVPFLTIGIYVLMRGPVIIWNFLFPYLHPPLLNIFKFLIPFLLLLTIVGLPTYWYINKCKLEIDKNSNFELLSMWFIRVINTQFFLKTSQGGLSWYKGADSGWNENLIGSGIKPLIIQPSSSLLKFQNFLLTLNFLVILILIFISIYFNSLT